LSRRRIPGDLAPRYQSEQCRPRQARPVAQFSLCPHCAADGSVQPGHRQRPCAPPGCGLQRPGEASPLVASDPRAADRGQGRRSAPAAKTRRSTGVTWSRFTLSTCTFACPPTADRNPPAHTPVRHATRRTRFLRSRAAGSSLVMSGRAGSEKSYLGSIDRRPSLAASWARSYSLHAA